MEKEIKIFLASSNELYSERSALGDLSRRLDDIYDSKGISIKLNVWEDFDASYYGGRTQDGYNKILSQCDMFIAIFHRKAGEFTVEEFEVARKHFEEHSSPKVYTYMKSLNGGESEAEELTIFKNRLFKELGHYWCGFDNEETMILHFVMQIQLLISNNIAKLDVKDSNIMLDNKYIANLNNISFAANNEKFIDINKQLVDIDRDIKNYESLLLTTPNDAINILLKNKCEEKINLKNKLNEYGKSLVNTALMITSLYGEVTNERLRLAVELFEKGDNKGANEILDPAEIALDIEKSAKGIKNNKIAIVKAQELARSTIEEYKQKIRFILLGAEEPDNMNKVYELHLKRIDVAIECSLPLEEIAVIYSEIAKFLIENPNIVDSKKELLNTYSKLSETYQKLADYYCSMVIAENI